MLVLRTLNICDATQGAVPVLTAGQLAVLHVAV